MNETNTNMSQQVQNNDPGNMPQGNRQPPKKRKTWLWVLGWIFIFPLPLTLILIKKPDMNKALKYGIIAAAWIMYFIIGFSGTANNSKTTNTYTSSVATQETTVNSDKENEETTAEPTTEKPTEGTTEKPTEKPTEKFTEKETEIITESVTPIVFTNYTNYVEAGSIATVTIQGKPNTEYSIHVYYDSGESKAEGLEDKTSDGNGYVTWEWKVGAKTTPGTHAITVKGDGTENSVQFEVLEE